MQSETGSFDLPKRVTFIWTSQCYNMSKKYVSSSCITCTCDFRTLITYAKLSDGLDRVMSRKVGDK